MWSTSSFNEVTPCFCEMEKLPSCICLCNNAKQEVSSMKWHLASTKLFKFTSSPRVHATFFVAKFLPIYVLCHFWPKLMQGHKLIHSSLWHPFTIYDSILWFTLKTTNTKKIHHPSTPFPYRKKLGPLNACCNASLVKHNL